MVKTRMPATERVVTYRSPIQGYFIIPSENGDWKLASELIAPMTQNRLARYDSNDGFRAQSMKTYFELFGDLYNLRGKRGMAENARKFIRKSMREVLQTLTRLEYKSRGRDIIIHDYGAEFEKRTKENLIEADGEITNVLSSETCLALTGKTREEVRRIMGYLNRTKDIYIWRLNVKPVSVEECVAGFYADSYGAYLVCNWYPLGSDPSLGVKRDAPKI